MIPSISLEYIHLDYDLAFMSHEFQNDKRKQMICLLFFWITSEKINVTRSFFRNAISEVEKMMHKRRKKRPTPNLRSMIGIKGKILAFMGWANELESPTA
jgi:hypothetical protein